jgi:hypothetical protein
MKGTMAALDLPDVHDEGFQVTSVRRERGIIVQLVGNADMRAISHLDTFLSALHRVLTKLSLEQATFDVRDLYFMNSSCLRCFVTFLIEAAELSGSTRYSVRFLSNPRMQWQTKSLEALRACAMDVVSVESS